MNERSAAPAPHRQAGPVRVRAETLGQLGAQFAHDFNNILAVALTSVEMAMRFGDPAKANVFLGNALKVIARGRILTDRLAAASHACESATTIDAGSLLMDICRSVPSEGSVDLRVTTRLEARQCVVSIDARFFEEALRNLIANARDATLDHGTLTISTRNATGAELRADAACDYLVITVEDTGPGMDEAVRDKAFDLFFSTRAADARFGLGLAQARDAMRRAGGTIAIDSRPHGTAVTLAIPLALAGR